MEVLRMKEILLSQLIEQTKEAAQSFEHSQSTSYQYQLAWRAISNYFHTNQQQMFSKQLAQEYMQELKAKYEAGSIKKWRYKLYRLTTRLLCEYYDQGYLKWGYQKQTLKTQLHQQNYVLLQKEYLHSLKKRGLGARTIQYYEIVSRQFLAFLELQKINDISEARVNDIHIFILSIAKRYQPTSMRTAFSALRSFCQFVESQKRTATCLSNAIPSSWGRKTAIIPTLTPTEEQKLLQAVDRTTPLGKRNYAMLLLALRLGLRSIDIVNLKLKNIDWNRSTIEIIQEKTNLALVLPLLTDVGNAIADYILNGRPDLQNPYLFLRTQAPFINLSGRSVCYGISLKIMKDAGIRQGHADRKGFHSLRHSVAARLLSEETPLPVISSILGHRNKDSTKVYLSIDLEHLGVCALNLNGIEVNREELR
jgi:site-specific recombinase XerD